MDRRPCRPFGLPLQRKLGQATSLRQKSSRTGGSANLATDRHDTSPFFAGKSLPPAGWPRRTQMGSALCMSHPSKPKLTPAYRPFPHLQRDIFTLHFWLFTPLIEKKLYNKPWGGQRADPIAARNAADDRGSIGWNAPC